MVNIRKGNGERKPSLFLKKKLKFNGDLKPRNSEGHWLSRLLVNLSLFLGHKALLETYNDTETGWRNNPLKFSVQVLIIFQFAMQYFAQFIDLANSCLHSDAFLVWSFETVLANIPSFNQ